MTFKALEVCYLMTALYIQGMANKKRDKNGYKKQLGRYRLSRADLFAIEKILWIYADAREMRHAGVDKLPEGRRHMPRRAIDRYASVGRYAPFMIQLGWGYYGWSRAGVDWIYYEDSVKFLSRQGYPKRTRYLELAAWPGIKVTFTPLSTTVYAQTHYATGNELKVMRRVVLAIELYLYQCNNSVLNKINLANSQMSAKLILGSTKHYKRIRSVNERICRRLNDYVSH